MEPSTAGDHDGTLLQLPEEQQRTESGVTSQDETNEVETGFKTELGRSNAMRDSVTSLKSTTSTNSSVTDEATQDSAEDLDAIEVIGGDLSSDGAHNPATTFTSSPSSPTEPASVTIERYFRHCSGMSNLSPFHMNHRAHVTSHVLSFADIPELPEPPEPRRRGRSNTYSSGTTLNSTESVPLTGDSITALPPLPTEEQPNRFFLSNLGIRLLKRRIRLRMLFSRKQPAETYGGSDLTEFHLRYHSDTTPRPCPAPPRNSAVSVDVDSPSTPHRTPSAPRGQSIRFANPFPQSPSTSLHSHSPLTFSAPPVYPELPPPHHDSTNSHYPDPTFRFSGTTISETEMSSTLGVAGSEYRPHRSRGGWWMSTFWSPVQIVDEDGEVREYRVRKRDLVWGKVVRGWRRWVACDLGLGKKRDLKEIV